MCSRGGWGGVRLLILGLSLKQIGSSAVGTGNVVTEGRSTCSVSDSLNFSNS